MMQARGASELARVASLLQRGDLPAAEAACRNVLANSPRNAAAIHLLGLVLKEAGNIAEGERLVRESIALEPMQAEFRSNLGALLRRAGRKREAAAAFREALHIDPRFRTARIGLAWTLSDLGEHSGAEAEARALIALNERDPAAWSTLATALRDQLRSGEAEAAYRRALLLAPQDPKTHHNLGSLLSQLDRAEEAWSELERARTLGLQGFELQFNRGTALMQLYRIEEAEQAFAEAVRLQPLDSAAQINLARVRFMRGDPNFTRGIVAAAGAHRGDLSIQVLLAQTLRRAGDLTAAETLLRELMTQHAPTANLRVTLAEVLLDSGRLKEAETQAAEAAAELPHDSGVIDVLVTILLARGRPDDATPFIRNQRLRHPLSQFWIAYEATAARLTGDPLYQHLFDYDRLIRTYDLESPPGYASMAELNAAVLEALGARHPFASHPLDQSLRNGSQTARNLLTDPDPHLQALLRVFQTPLDDYVRAIGSDPEHLLSARNRGAARITGAWSVQLRREGFHVNHVHPQGWISSAYYVAVPEEVNDGQLMSGWLKFGETRYPIPGAGPEGVVQPRPGRLVLFPSYMWHGTNPIHGAEPRVTVAFDAVPGDERTT